MTSRRPAGRAAASGSSGVVGTSAGAAGRTSSAIAGQQAVDEATRAVRREARRELDRLGQHHAGGHVGPGDQLRGAHAQRGPVEGGHAGERPALGEALEQRVDPGAVLVDGQHERGGEVVRGHGEGGEHLGARGALGLGLVEQAERTLPGRPPLGGEGQLTLG